MAIMGSSSSPRSNNNNNASTPSNSSTAGPQFRVGTATTSPEFVAVILAATHGANLFPFTAAPCNTSSSNNKNDNDATTLPLLQPPKHLLPLVGVSLLHRLIKCLQQCGGFSNIVICIALDDDVTIPSFQHDGGWKADDVATTAANTIATTTDPTTATSAATDASFRNSPVVILQQQAEIQDTTSINTGFCNQQQRLIIVRLPLGGEGGEGGGSIDALRQVEATRIISKHSHIVVFPSDLVVLHGTVAIQQFVHAHRLRQQQQQHEEESSSTNFSSDSSVSSSPVAAAACTVLLADVGEEDENGIPLKESAKQKKGGLARQDEAIEYTALAYDDNDDYNHHHNSITTPRLIWKQSKFDVEADEHFTGNTPKLVLPKPRLRLSSGGGTMTTTTTTVKVQTNWNDLHVYIFSPWVRRLITTRTSLLSIQNDLIPLLIARQTKGICATFGSKMDKIKVHDILRNDNNNNNNGVIMADDDSVAHSSSSSPTPHHHPPSSSSAQGLLSKVARTTSSSSDKQGVNVGGEVPHWLTCEYSVLAHVIPGAAAVRANSIPAFLHASKELVTQIIVASSSSSSSRTSSSTRTNPCLFLPPNSTVRAKSFSVILPETTNDMLGEKITFKSSIIGRYCKLGAKCRLNNVIIFDNVTLGDNCIIQNTIIGPCAVIGDNCSLNDCQVAPSKVVVSGTKQKGEALLLDDDHDHHDHDTY